MSKARAALACAALLMSDAAWTAEATSAVGDQALAAGDRARGAVLYAARCGGCHSIEDNGPGPRHQGLLGRKAGSQPGFAYSTALGSSGVTWTAALLDRWLADPSALVPGNAMVVRLANDPRDRADIIAFLKEATAVRRAAACGRSRARAPRNHGR